MKKRILSILITLAVSISFILCLSACDLFANDETIYGHWKTDTRIMGSGDNILRLNDKVNLFIYEDGTLSATKYDSTNTLVEGDGTWVDNGGVYDIVINFVVSDGLETLRFSGTISKQYLTLTHSFMPYKYIMEKVN